MLGALFVGFVLFLVVRVEGGSLSLLVVGCCKVVVFVIVFPGLLSL